MPFTEPQGNMSSMQLPVCSCCKRHIMPGDKSVKFDCPNCLGGDLIWRCQSCRESAKGYTCSKCNFGGP